MQNLELSPEMSQPIGIYICCWLKDQRLITVRTIDVLKMSPQRLFLRLGPLIGLLGITAWLLLAPNPLPFGISVQRELGFAGHLGLFTMVTLACAATFPREIKRTTAALLLAAICLEAVQFFAPTRDADFADVVMNWLGILLGLVVFHCSVALRSFIPARDK